MKAVLVSVLLVSTASASEKAEPPVVSIKTKVSKTKTESSLTVDVVSATLQANYHAHIHRCYRERFGAKPAPSAKGTLKLVFGVEADGTTIGAIASSFDKKLDTCIAERARTWTFPPPKDKTDKPIATSFVYELALAPITTNGPVAKRGESELEEAARYADSLFSEGNTPKGDMSRRKPGADLGAQLNEVKEGGRGPAVASGGGHAGRVGSSTSPTSPSGPPRPSGPPGRVTVSSRSALDETSLTPDAVLKKILSVYMAGLKRCYKNALDVNPTLRGKLQMSFTVDAMGKATRATVKSFDTALDACVKEMVERWRFAPPKDGDQSTTARFEFALTLAPD